MKHIVTPRLLMRPFAESDFDDLFLLCSDTGAMEYTSPNRPLTAEETAEFLEKMIAEFVTSGNGIFAVIERKEKRFTGLCGLQKHSSNDFSALHFIFTADAIAKGLALEASMGLLRTAFNEWNVKKVIAECPEENRAFINILERIGMRPDHDRFENKKVLYSLEKQLESSDSIFEHRYQNSPRISLQQV